MHGILKAATNGGERREHDFYPTPPEPTIALARKLRCWPSAVWEPACGDGGIARPLEAAGFRVLGTDLIHRGYGEGGIDFLQTTRRRADAIITNPPFGELAHPFIEHAIRLGAPFIAMLLNINFWSVEVRTALWERRPPSTIYALSWRPDFTGAGRPYFNCIWTVWEPGSTSSTLYERLPKPDVFA